MLERELEDGRWSEGEGWMAVMLLLAPVSLHPRRILRDHDPRGTKGLPRLQDLGRLPGDLALLVSGRSVLFGSESATINLRPEVRSDVPAVQARRRERRSRTGSERRWPSVGPGGRKPRLERRLMDAMLRIDANDRRIGETEHGCNNNNNNSSSHNQQGYWISRQERLKLFVASCMKEC